MSDTIEHIYRGWIKKSFMKAVTCPPECPHHHLYLCPWQSPCPSQTQPTWHWPHPRWPGGAGTMNTRRQMALSSWPGRRLSCGRFLCCSPRCSPLSQSLDSSRRLTRSSCSSTSSLPTAHGRVKFKAPLWGRVKSTTGCIVHFILYCILYIVYFIVQTVLHRL